MLVSWSPLRGMRDVRRGSAAEQAAAWRHNRSARYGLIGCACRWLACAALALVLTAGFDAAAGSSVEPSLCALLAATSAGFVVCAVCVLAVIGYLWLWLARAET